MKGFFFGILIVLAFLTSYPSKAAVGALVGNPVIIYGGLAVTSGAAIVTEKAYAFVSKKIYSNRPKLPGI